MSLKQQLTPSLSSYRYVYPRGQTDRVTRETVLPPDSGKEMIRKYISKNLTLDLLRGTSSFERRFFIVFLLWVIQHRHYLQFKSIDH